MNTKEEFKQLQQELESLKDRIDEVDDKLAEAHELKHALDELKQEEPGTEALVPLSSGVFLQATIENTSKLHVNVGGGAVVEKTIPETKTMVNEHIAELQDARGDIEDQYEDLVDRADKLSQHIQHP